MRLGSSNLNAIKSPGELLRKVDNINWHPEYKPGSIYFDVGIAITDTPITFTSFIRSVCLPFLPVDEPDHLKDELLVLDGWRSSNLTKQKLIPNSRSVKVVTLNIILIVLHH